jgi:hypothetical protein
VLLDRITGERANSSFGMVDYHLGINPGTHRRIEERRIGGTQHERYRTFR